MFFIFIQKILFTMLLSVVVYFLIRRSYVGKEVLEGKKKKIVFFFHLFLVGIMLPQITSIWQQGFFVFLSYISMVCILCVTSVMDEKSGMFLLGYPVIGILIQSVCFVVLLRMEKIPGNTKEIFLMYFFLFLLFCGGFICYSLGDGALLFMSGMSYFFLFDSSLWGMSVFVTIEVAFISFVVRHILGKGWKECKKRRELPFTVHILVGVFFTILLYK